jgi:alkanesulfonate monooxygenase SsuD/methylene tetrahydromethanopterin reductase-like flavin-dependent oxidoreductase (luciferase family)
MFPAAPAGHLVDAVVRAEELGLDEVWIADEGIAREPMAVLAAAARETSVIRLAVGITSPLLRHPGAIAATAATIDELSAGRFTLGLGVGGQKSLEPFGLSTDRAVAVLREAIVTARAVLAAESAQGYEPGGHAIGRREVPIWVGTRGPQLIRLAARLADGVFLSGCTPTQHESIALAMKELDSTAEMALYQSASDVVDSPSVLGWDDVGAFLAEEARRWQPAAIGINLVDLNDGSGDPVALVERAAEILRAV